MAGSSPAMTGRAVRAKLHRSIIVTVLVYGKGMVKALLIMLVLIMPLAAFGAEDAPKSFLEGPDTDFAKSLVADLHAGNYDVLELAFDPSLQNANLRPTLEQMATLLPPEHSRSVEIGVKTVTTVHNLAHDRTTRWVSVFLQYEFSGKWVVASLRWHSVAGEPNVIDTFRLQPLTAPLETIHRFTLWDKDATHFVMLAALIAAPVFSLVVLVVCLRTPMRWWRKTLWAAAILLGVARVQFNWTTGAFAIDPLDIQLLSSGFFRASQLSPWVLYVAVPLAAIIFLARRRMGGFVPTAASAAGT